MSQNSEILNNSMANRFGQQLTFLPEVSHVSHIQQQESEKAKKILATSGRKCLESFEQFSRNGSWAKMLAGYLVGQGDWYSKRCKLIWKLKGTKYKRFYFQLQVLTLPTSETEFGLWQTPVTNWMLPNPRTTDVNEKTGVTIGKNGGFYRNGSLRGANLCDVVKLLPTPTATSDAKGGCSRPNPKRQNDTLAHAMHALEGHSKTSQLNPPFVEEMMGFPIGWTELKLSETPSSRKSRSKSLKQ